MKPFTYFVILVSLLLNISEVANVFGVPSSKSGIAVNEKECQYFPEVVLVLDVSDSFNDDLQNLRKLMPDLLKYFATNFDGHCRLGIVTFIDKPIDPWGHPGFPHRKILPDYCAKVELPLTSFDSTSVERVQNVFKRLKATGGEDYFEGANEAMFRVAASDAVGWSTESHDAETGRPILRILALLTDAPVHDPVYFNELEEFDLPPHDLNKTEHLSQLHKDINYRCDATDYPTPASIKAVLNRRNITTIILSGQPAKAVITLESEEYQDLLTRYNKVGKDWDNVNTGLKAYYEWYMKTQVNVTSFVELVDESTSNFIGVFEEGVRQAKDAKCLAISSNE